jgi:hypothetical protein
MTTYDPEDQAERRRVGGLLQGILADLGMRGGGQNSSTLAERNSTRKIFAVTSRGLGIVD